MRRVPVERIERLIDDLETKMEDTVNKYEGTKHFVTFKEELEHAKSAAEISCLGYMIHRLKELID